VNSFVKKRMKERGERRTKEGEKEER